MSAPEDNPADDVQPTKEEWEAYEAEKTAMPTDPTPPPPTAADMAMDLSVKLAALSLSRQSLQETLVAVAIRRALYAEARLAAVTAERDAALAMLRRCEWDAFDRCVICDEIASCGHAPGCELAAMLRARAGASGE